jgi:hypothetical protein
MTRSIKRNNIKVTEKIAHKNNRALTDIKACNLSTKDKDIKMPLCVMKNGKCTTQPVARSKKNKKHDYSDDESGDSSDDDSGDSSDDDSGDSSEDDSGDSSEDESDDSSDDDSDDE